MVHPRDRQEISSIGVSLVHTCVGMGAVYLCLLHDVRDIVGVCVYVCARAKPGEDENGTVTAKGRGWMVTLIARDSRDRCSRSPRKMTYRAAWFSWNAHCVNTVYGIHNSNGED